jgi:hypothetical protein
LFSSSGKNMPVHTGHFKNALHNNFTVNNLLITSYNFTSFAH